MGSVKRKAQSAKLKRKTKNVDLSVKLGKIRMKNPVMVASGTFGYGKELEDLVDLEFAVVEDEGVHGGVGLGCCGGRAAKAPVLGPGGGDEVAAAALAVGVGEGVAVAAEVGAGKRQQGAHAIRERDAEPGSARAPGTHLVTTWTLWQIPLEPILAELEEKHHAAARKALLP